MFSLGNDVKHNNAHRKTCFNRDLIAGERNQLRHVLQILNVIFEDPI